MSTENFFELSKEHSQVKSKIVSQYFVAWARIMIGPGRINRIAYIDLYAGPGKYEDNTKSTPLLILEAALQEPAIRDRLVTLFNDVKPEHVELLKKNISEIPLINQLKYAPEVIESEVEQKTAKFFGSIKLVPSLAFIDPFGYKGLSIDLIGAFLKDWGCDCIFFFNYSRVNMALNNRFMRKNVEFLFGVERTEKLSKKTRGLSPSQRERLIIHEIKESLKASGGLYTQCFRFAKGDRPTHHLIFVSKHPLGCTIIKAIMASYSLMSRDGVPHYEFNNDPPLDKLNLHFEMFPKRPLEDLEQILLNDFKGRCLTMKDLFSQHNVGKPFLEKNYKDALRSLESMKIIECTPQSHLRRLWKGVKTFGDEVLIKFP